MESSNLSRRCWTLGAPMIPPLNLVELRLVKRDAPVARLSEMMT